MSRPSIEPVTEASLPEFASFLHAHLDSQRSAQAWESQLRAEWPGDRPNYGFALRDEGRIVGGIGAYYASRIVRGRPEKFCNITSWCVLDSYRQQSMRLAMAVIGQPGYHFTDFSPTRVVGATLQFFKFRPLDERQAVILNLPGFLPGGARVVCEPQAIAAALTGEDLEVYRDHAAFSWLRHVLVGRPGRWCHVIYKRRIFKRLPAAAILYVSDGELFLRHFRRFSSHLLARGLATTHVECRFIARRPWPSAIRSGFNPKLYLSPTLQAEDIDYLYSESMALDL